MPVLEPIKIQSADIAEDGSSDSEPEDKENIELAYDSDDDSDPEADRQINKIRDEGDGRCRNHIRNWNEINLNLVNYKGNNLAHWLERGTSSLRP